ncbi:sensor histidine kinase [Nocardia sp. NPDC058633]|uniref:sensor histidine kinase n=1 Tax=Nocardia sp. NPDC058633 TaxID=3346568 RepID=UPI0036674AA5
MTQLPISVLAVWPGRFRFVELLIVLTESPDSASTTAVDAVLAGLIAGQDEPAVFDELVAAGRFEVASRMVEECPGFTDDATRLRKCIHDAQEDRRGELEVRLRALSERAEHAGVSFVCNIDCWMDVCGSDWSKVERDLRKLEDQLLTDIDSRRTELRALHAIEASQPAERQVYTALIDAGHLRAAQRMLDSGAAPTGPEAAPRLSRWEWTDPAEEVLRWYTDAPQRRPMRFERLNRRDTAANDTVEACQRLWDDIAGASSEVAIAFNSLLGADRDAIVVHPVAGGSLATLHNLFDHPQTRRFHPGGTIEVYVAERGTTHVPDELVTATPYIALGPDLVKSRAVGRTAVATITLRDLLLLVAQPAQYRSVSVLRLAARQWPIAALSADSPVRLEKIWGNNEGDRFSTLCWLLDLAGIGDTVAADMIAYQTGLDSGLTVQLLDYLLQRENRGLPIAAGIGIWARDGGNRDRVAATILTPISRSPQAVLAFWAAYTAQAEGMSRASDAAAQRDDEVAADAVRAGWNELETLWLLNNEPDGAIRFRSCGALVALRDLAPAKLEEAQREVLKRSIAVDADSLRLDRWVQHRHALSPAREEYLRLVDDPTVAAITRMAVWDRMHAQTAGIVDVHPRLTGRTDIDAVLQAMRSDFVATHSDLHLVVDNASGLTVAVTAELLAFVVFELVDNAAEAVRDSTGRGTISVSARAEEGDVILTVRDSGPGFGRETESAYRFLRKGVGTRGPGRGNGLYQVRQLAQSVDGDLFLDSGPQNHPVLSGARIRVVLPAG